MIARLKKLLVRGGLVYFTSAFLSPLIPIVATKYLPFDFPTAFIMGFRS